MKKGKSKQEVKHCLERCHRKRQFIDSDEDEDPLPSQVKRHEGDRGFIGKCCCALIIK